MTDRLGPTVYVPGAGPYGFGSVTGMPLDGYVTDPWGSWSLWRQENGLPKHQGVDIAAPGNPPLYAMAPGVVRWAGFDGIAGNYVSITTTGGGEYQYLHLNAPASVQTGDFVRRGDLVGYMGATGRVTGAHVHVNYNRYAGGLTPWEDCIPYFAASGLWSGRIHRTGLTPVLWHGGSMGDLAGELKANRIQSCTVYIDGEPLVYVTGAPAFANGDFTQRFQEGVPDRTILILKPEGA